MRKSLLAGCAAAVAALLAVPSLSSADEVFQASLGELIVHGGPLVSFDISWVDPDPASPVHNDYFLADRSNSQVDVIPIEVNPPSFFIKSPAPFNFAGNVLCPDGAANDCAGPNGVLTFHDDPEGTFEIWTGDGPTKNPFCPNPAVACSTVKVYQGFATNLLAVIPTTGPGFPGEKRADELCFAPKTAGHPGRILVANDADDPPYITFIDTDGPNRTKVVKQIAFPQATAGIEQCQFDPTTDLFYLNLPEDSNFGGDGAVHRFSAVDFSEPAAFDISTAVCEHPQGMALATNITFSGGKRAILLGCNGATSGGSLDSVIIRGDNGATVTGLFNEGGADEAWWDPGSFMWFIAEGGCTSNCGLNKQGIEQLGIIDVASVLGSKVSDPFNGGQDVFVGFQGNTTRRAHSVAAWSGALGTLGNFTIAFVPVPATGGGTGGTASFSSTLCNQFSAQGCIGMLAVSPIPSFSEEASE